MGLGGRSISSVKTSVWKVIAESLFFARPIVRALRLPLLVLHGRGLNEVISHADKSPPYYCEKGTNAANAQGGQVYQSQYFVKCLL